MKHRKTKRNSFIATTIIIQIGIICLIVKIDSIESCVNLSAKGSINFPKSVMKLNFLAIVPSKMSVIPEIENTIIAPI